ncbi:MAG: U32 family peptidase [Lachnospiraceae bacterium]|nr:U32 family peptidase [Lachnospiraceae bacterium]
MEPRVEILAPAGSMESMIAAINAGADAVYMGGSRFGARAYADNPEEDRFLDAINYAHLHGCRLYMTVNTLVKETELDQVYEFLKPYYERGLDAVIVQDMGVFAVIRKAFPDLPIHASTQMTVTGCRSAAYLKELGATRVVTARELSLEEIARIRDEVDIEIESFVHGALCYCYSGQCLLSSLIGGRSGNRGRCAQPCRLPYEVQGQAAGGQKGKGDERYVLSLKDLCTLDILPEVIEAGVYSLKIEGRMKSPRYTAGVVSIYRKYTDLYLKHGREGYRVKPEDRAMLLELFDRGGFTEGYYRQHNGREMIALKEKPAFREGNQALFERLDRDFVEKKRQEPITGHVVMREQEPIRLELRLDSMPELSPIVVSGAEVQTAQNQPFTEEKLLKQMNKTGNTPFVFDRLTAELSGACFLPVQALNELRRQGMEQLEEAVLSRYHRVAEAEEPCDRKSEAAVTTAAAKQADNAADRADAMKICVSLEDMRGFSAALSNQDVDAIYLDSVGFGAETWADCAAKCRKAEKACALILPHIFRSEAERYLTKHQDELKQAGFSALVLRSMEEVAFLRELGMGDIPLIFDANLYTMNHRAAEQMMQMGASGLTLPLELNSHELEELKRGVQKAGADQVEWEMVAYGYLPAMVSANCVVRTMRGCTGKPELVWMKDRTGKQLPVRSHCRFCYNTIYNPSPLSLLGQERIVERIAPSVLRLAFTIETPQQIQAVIAAYVDHFRYGKDTPVPFTDFTRGHLKRGVE